MKKSIASALAVLSLSLFTACGGGSAAAVGSYHLDVDALFASIAGDMKGAPADMLAGMKAKMSGSIELKADQTATFAIDMGVPMVPKQNETGTWKLAGNVLTMTTKKGDKEESKSAKLENGVITIEEEQAGKKMQMLFKRK
jgi:hypothetical protein